MFALVVILCLQIGATSLAEQPNPVPEKKDPPDNGLLTSINENTFQLGGVTLDRKEKTLTFPVVVNQVDAVIEYALVSESGKTHESLLKTSVAPRDVHLASLLLGVVPSPSLGQTNQVAGLPNQSTLTIALEWKEGPVSKVCPLQQLISLTAKDSQSRTGKLCIDRWLYSGSLMHQGAFIAQEEGSVISLIRDPAALINNPGIDRDNDDMHIPEASLLPAVGTPARIVFQFTPGKPDTKP